MESDFIIYSLSQKLDVMEKSKSRFEFSAGKLPQNDLQVMRCKNFVGQRYLVKINFRYFESPIWHLKISKKRLQQQFTTDFWQITLITLFLKITFQEKINEITKLSGN